MSFSWFWAGFWWVFSCFWWLLRMIWLRRRIRSAWRRRRMPPVYKPSTSRRVKQVDIQLTIQYRCGLSCLNAAFPIKMAYIHIIIISYIYKIIQSVYYIVPLFLLILLYTWLQQGARSRGEADVRAARDPTAAAQRPPRAEARLVSHSAI